MMRKLSAKAESLAKRARGTGDEALAKRIYEALKYSAPVTNDSTCSIEEEILNRLSNGEISEEILELVERRNELVKDRVNKHSK